LVDDTAQEDEDYPVQDQPVDEVATRRFPGHFKVGSAAHDANPGH
jgi:hypothetical protein